MLLNQKKQTAILIAAILFLLVLIIGARQNSVFASVSAEDQVAVVYGRDIPVSVQSEQVVMASSGLSLQVKEVDGHDVKDQDGGDMDNPSHGPGQDAEDEEDDLDRDIGEENYLDDDELDPDELTEEELDLLEELPKIQQFMAEDYRIDFTDNQYEFDRYYRNNYVNISYSQRGNAYVIARVVDLDNNEVNGINPIEYTLAEDYVGISIDRYSGQLTIASDTPYAIIRVIARCDDERIGGYVEASTDLTIVDVSAEKVETGAIQTFVLDNTGHLWVAGQQMELGLLGNGSMEDAPRFERLTTIDQVVDVSSSGFTLVLREDGSVWSWGPNFYGNLGNGSAGDDEYSAIPIKVDIDDVVAISAMEFTAMALRSDGTVWMWGHTYDGEQYLPTQVHNLSDIAAIACGENNAFALHSNGTVWAWGDNSYGHMGNGTYGDHYQFTPMRVKGLTDVVAVSTSPYHVLALKSDGTVWAWGVAECFEPQDNGTNPSWGSGIRTMPIQIEGLSDIIHVEAAISGANYAIQSNGTLWSWGYNDVGQLGIDSDVLWSTPVPVITGVVQASSGDYNHSLLVTRTNGTLWGLGDSEYGHFGVGEDYLGEIYSFAHLAEGVFYKIAEEGIKFEQESYQAIIPSQGVVQQQFTAFTHDVNGMFVEERPIQYRLVDTYGGVNIDAQTGLVTITSSAVAGVVEIEASYQGYLATAELILQDAPATIKFEQLSYQAVIPLWRPLEIQMLAHACDEDGERVNVDLTYRLMDDYEGVRIDAATGLLTIESHAVAGVLEIEASYEDLSTRMVLILSKATGQRLAIAQLSANYHILALLDDGSVGAWGYNNSGQVGNGTTDNSWTPLYVLDGVSSVSAGADFSLALREDGTVWGWGLNKQGQLGEFAEEHQLNPVQVYCAGEDGSLLALEQVVQVAAGFRQGLALKEDGTVWAWGDLERIEYRRLTADIPNVLQQVPGLNQVIAIGAGREHNLALKEDGTVWGWGRNSYGQFGNGTTDDSDVPVQVLGLTGVMAISVGDYCNLALKEDGTVWAWGYNEYGQLGNGTIDDSDVPVQVSDLSGVIAISAGGYHILALKEDGTVWAWGYNGFGQLGNGTTTDSYLPVQVQGIDHAVAIEVSSDYSLAILEDGSLWGWGANYSGHLGPEAEDNQLTPIRIFSEYFGPADADPNPDPEVERIEFIQGSYQAIIPDVGPIILQIIAGAYDEEDELVNVALTYSLVEAYDGVNIEADTGLLTIEPTAEAGIVKIRASYGDIAATAELVLEARNDPDPEIERIEFAQSSYQAIIPSEGLTTIQITARAYDADDQLMDVLLTYSLVEVYEGVSIEAATGLLTIEPNAEAGAIEIEASYKDVSTTVGVVLKKADEPGPNPSGLYVVQADGGDGFSVVLLNDGSVWSWGSNTYGQLGNNMMVDSLAAVQVEGLGDVVEIAVGGDFVLALKDDGTVWGWGRNNLFQLGQGAIGNKQVPVQIMGLEDIVKVAAGQGHSMALAADGKLWCWGLNGNGQVGNGALANQSIPTQVALANVTDIVAGGVFSLAALADGTVWAWGANGNGQLGIGNNESQSLPVQVVDLVDVSTLAGGQNHVLAVTAEGTVWSWGNNANWQLGVTGAAQNAPVQIVELLNAKDVAAGTGFSLVLLTDGSVWSFGLNGQGQLGDSTTNRRAEPQAITGLADVVSIGGGVSHGLAVTREGKVYGWGSNATGQLGLEDSQYLEPVELQEGIFGGGEIVEPPIEGELRFVQTSYHAILPSDETLTLSIVARLYDEENVPQIVEVHYALEEAYAGVDVEEMTGMVTIEPGVEAGTVVIVASYGGQRVTVELVIQGETPAQLEIMTMEGKEYDLMISASQIRNFTGKIVSLYYDEVVFELVDLCLFTAVKEVTVGAIEEAGIVVTVVNPGEICFAVTKEIPDGMSWSGVLTGVRLRAKAAAVTLLEVSLQ